MFWERYCALCTSVRKAPNVVASEIGIKSSGTVTGWKNGAVPRPLVLQKLSKYFGVPVSYLTGEEEKTPFINENEELTEFLQMLKTRPECRMLFQLTKNATKEDVEAAVRIIEALRNK